MFLTKVKGLNNFMKKYLIIIATLLTMGSFSMAACSDEVSDEVIDGGTTDYSNNNAPKTITSENIIRFSLTVEDDTIEYNNFYGRFVMEIEPTAKGFKMSLSCGQYSNSDVKYFSKSRIIDKNTLKELQAIIKEHNIASINGHSKWNSALGNYINLHIVYDTGETINVNAEGGCAVVPDNWNQDWFLNFFFDKLDIQCDKTNN